MYKYNVDRYKVSTLNNDKEDQEINTLLAYLLDENSRENYKLYNIDVKD